MGGGIRCQRSGMFAAALLLAPDAFACSFASRAMSRAQVEGYARAQYAKASAVVDAEVEQPMSFGPVTEAGAMPAGILQVIRYYKGAQPPGYERIPLIYFSSCDIGLMRKGERIRILLMDGPKLFRADSLANSPPADREEAQAEFNAEIDRLAGAPRPSGFSTYPGEIDPSETTRLAAENDAKGNAASPARPAAPARSASPGRSIYIVGALGLFLAFLAGLLIGRRSKRAAGAVAG